MANKTKIRTSGSVDQAQTGLAVDLKRQMNELIDIIKGRTFSCGGFAGRG